MRLLESDADMVESRMREMESKLSRILWTNVGILVSLSTGAILMAANLLVVQ